MCKTFPEAKCVTCQCKVCVAVGIGGRGQQEKHCTCALGSTTQKYTRMRENIFGWSAQPRTFLCFNSSCHYEQPFGWKLIQSLVKKKSSDVWHVRQAECLHERGLRRKVWSAAVELTKILVFHPDAFISSSVTRLVFSSNTTMVIRLRLSLSHNVKQTNKIKTVISVS